MEISYLSIAEHVFKVHTESTMLREWLKSSFSVLNDEESRNVLPDMNVHIETSYGIPFETFDVDVREDEESIIYQRADYQITICKSFNRAKIEVFDTFALKHAMMNLYSTFIVHHEWGLLVHSSCVVEKEKAYLFSGYSGAGKSTVAKLSMPRPLLSDEATIVKLNSPDNVVVFNSPFRSELNMNAEMGSCTLKGVYLLHQSLNVESRSLKKGEGFLKLTDKIFYWSYNAKETVKIFRLCKQLAEAVPIFELYFQKNDSFWEMIS